MNSLIHLTTTLLTHSNSTQLVLRSTRATTIPKAVPKLKGYWTAVSFGMAGLLAFLPPRPVLASQTSLELDISVNTGPIAVQFNITNPVAQPGGVFKSTLHIHARDDTQTPDFNADLNATGQAADADTLLGGFLPAALIVKQDELAGMTFQQASADAQAKTGVTVTSFHDATMTEYALLLVAVLLLSAVSGVAVIQPGLGDQACNIRAKLEAGLAALGFQNPPDPCRRGATTP
jgi:hypothetical protein